MDGRCPNFVWALLVLMAVVHLTDGNNFFNNRVQHQNQQMRPKPPLNHVGFVGGPDSDVTVMTMYHLFRRFLAYMVFKQGNFDLISN